jgi:transcriptional regulator with XRE-family HTH domain
MNLLAKKIRELRIARGKSQAELVRTADVSASMVSRAENGDTIPSEATLQALERALEAPGQLFQALERMRNREDSLWMGFAPGLLTAPLILLAQRFVGRCRLVAAHSYRDTPSDGVELQPNARVRAEETAISGCAFTTATLRTQLLDGTLDGAWVPRSVFTSHRDVLSRHATLRITGFLADQLAIVPHSFSAALRQLSDFWSHQPVILYIAESDGEQEFNRISQARPEGLNARRCTTMIELIDQARTTLGNRQPVLCFMGEPHAHQLEQGISDLGRVQGLQRNSGDYRNEHLPELGQTSVDLVFTTEAQKRLPKAGLAQVIEKLELYTSYVNGQQPDDLESVVQSLNLPMHRLRERLSQLGAIELSLTTEALKLSNA